MTTKQLDKFRHINLALTAVGRQNKEIRFSVAINPEGVQPVKGHGISGQFSLADLDVIASDSTFLQDILVKLADIVFERAFLPPTEQPTDTPPTEQPTDTPPTEQPTANQPENN